MGLKVVSLFDGICCGKEAFDRANIKIDKYIAYEIDKNAIKVALTNHPEITEKGNIIDADFKQYKNYDIVIGGSPCQGFSFAGKQLNFNDPRSKLFFEYVRAIKEIQPKWFLLENVVMKKEYEDVITNALGVEPVMINSSLVSAQTRKRLYWTNIPNVSQPKDKNILLKDILEDIPIKGKKYELSEINKATILGRRINEKGHRDDYNKSIPISQCVEVRASNRDKSNCLTTVNKDNVLTPLPIGRHKDAYKNNLPFRYYTVKELCRLQTLPDNYCDMIPESVAVKALGNGWTVDVISYIFGKLKEVMEE